MEVKECLLNSFPREAGSPRDILQWLPGVQGSGDEEGHGDGGLIGCGVEGPTRIWYHLGSGPIEENSLPPPINRREHPLIKIICRDIQKVGPSLSIRVTSSS